MTFDIDINYIVYQNVQDIHTRIYTEKNNLDDVVANDFLFLRYTTL